ncbi:MAG: type I-C CRISPR-associated protein Cas8c/Csd1 [Armatimonadota bacterium]
MIHQLVDYAIKKQLVTVPGFAPKTVKWLIWIDTNGNFQDVTELGDPSQRRNPGQEFPWCPDLQQNEITAGGQIRSHFLVDTCEVVALFRVQNDPKKEQKHRYFIKLLREASKDYPLCGVAADALADPQTLEDIRNRLETLRAKPADKVTIRVGNQTLVESDAWHSWWQQFRGSLKDTSSSASQRRVCFATGQPTVPAETHPKISGLADVGGQPTGTVLIGFDKDAFTSYGLKQSANCAVSEDAAYAYRAALIDLLANSSHRLVNQKVVHWYSTSLVPEDDPITLLLGDSQSQREATAQESARRLLQSLHRGERPIPPDTRFYLITLSGSGGRVMVRDWVEGSFNELVENVNAWFDHLAIVRRDGVSLAGPPKFLAVAGALVRDLQDIPAPTLAKLFHSALKNEPIPREVMTQALARVKVDIVKDNTFHEARMGLLKAYHIRKGGNNSMSAYLNPNHPDPAYHCGRLMAVLANLQRTALPQVEGGIVQRFYAAASATPALVLGRLVRTAQFHIDKVRSDSPGLAMWYEERIAEVMSALGDRFPRTLSLEEQSLFALGYYQQLAYDRTSKSDKKEDSQP